MDFVHEKKFVFSSLMQQMLYENSVGLGVGSFLVKFDRSSFCIPRERSDDVALTEQTKQHDAKTFSDEYLTIFKGQIKHVYKCIYI